MAQPPKTCLFGLWGSATPGRLRPWRRPGTPPPTAATTRRCTFRSAWALGLGRAELSEGNAQRTPKRAQPKAGSKALLREFGVWG